MSWISSVAVRAGSTVASCIVVAVVVVTALSVVESRQAALLFFAVILLALWAREPPPPGASGETARSRISSAKIAVNRGTIARKTMRFSGGGTTFEFGIENKRYR